MTTRKKREKRESKGEVVPDSDIENRDEPSDSAALQKLRSLLEEIRRASKEYPATAIVAEAMVIRATAMIEAFVRRRPDAFEEVVRSLAEITEIGSWITDGRPSPNYEAFALPWIEARLVTIGELLQLDRAAQKFRRLGRPVTKRALALLALDEKLRDPSKSWARLAMELRYCDAETNLRVCGERLRKQAKELERRIASLSSGEKA